MSWFSKIRKKAILDAAPVSKVFGFDRGTPIDRLYIERFINEHADDIKGDVLEVGENTYTEKFGKTRTKSMIFSYGEKTGQHSINGDLSSVNSLPEAVADCFICTQTFNFIYDIRGGVDGARHLLKPGGVLLATVACLAPVSAYDAERWGDFWRITPQGCERLFGEAFGKAVKVVPLGNSAAASLFVKGYAAEDLPDNFPFFENDPLFPVVIGVRAVK